MNKQDQKVLKSFGVKLGDKVQIGIKYNGYLLNGEGPENWSTDYEPINATIVGIMDGCYPLAYIDDEGYSKLPSNASLQLHTSGEVDSKFKSKIDTVTARRWGIIDKSNIRVNTMSKIKEKFGVEIGDQIDVYVDEEVGFIETAEHDTEINTTIKGTVVGFVSGQAVVHFDNDELDKFGEDIKDSCLSFIRRPKYLSGSERDFIDYKGKNFVKLQSKQVIADPTTKKKSKKKSKKEQEPIVDSWGHKKWLNAKGQLHRLDGPAQTNNDGEWWYKNGKLHREDGPAVSMYDGTTTEYWVSGKKHRLDGPAVEDKEERSKEYWVNGKLHREDGPSVINDDVTEYHINGKYHRLDGPAIKYKHSKDEYWYKNGKLHREDGPALKEDSGFCDITKGYYIEGKEKTEADIKKLKEEKACVTDCYGTKKWLDKNGNLHRTKGPALERSDGTKEWFKKGLRHRKDGPAIEHFDGSQEWYVNGLLHRCDGPAIVNSASDKYWYVNGKSHREDGPAIEHTNGSKTWYLDDVEYSEKDFNKKIAAKDLKQTVLANGTKEWRNKNGDLHREDGPAIEHFDGAKEWYINGQLHREDGPAIISKNGDHFWCINGQYHNDKGPAIINANGAREWYVNGVHHRVNGPALETVSGIKQWYKDGKLHCEDGPAIINSNGTKEWFVNGTRHRVDGPAIEYKNGSVYYYVDGNELSKSQFDELTNSSSPIKYGLKLGDKVLLKRTSSGSFIANKGFEEDNTGQYPPVPATVVGSDRGAPTLCIDIDSAYNSGGIYGSYESNVALKYRTKKNESKKFWYIYDQSAIATPEKYGVKVGDEVEIGLDWCGRLIDHHITSRPRSSTIKGKVVGFEYRGGTTWAPLVYIDRSLVSHSEGKFNSAHERDVLPQFLEDKSIDTKNGCFWYIFDQQSIKKIEPIQGKENKTMSTKTDKPTFLEIMKVNANDAAYRVASTQITKGTKAAILGVMEKNGHGDRLGALSDLLDSEMGGAIISAALGYGLTYMPKIGEDPRAQKLASEFRINGMATAGNVAMDTVMEHLLPVILGALSTLPEEKVATQARIADHNNAEEEESAQETEGKRATA